MTKAARLFPDGLLGLPPIKLQSVFPLLRPLPKQEEQRPWHDRTWAEVSEDGWLPAERRDS